MGGIKAVCMRSWGEGPAKWFYVAGVLLIALAVLVGQS